MGEYNTTHNIINILDDSLIDKIAAGEVVENPASIVKELIENSIDADADNIEITVKQGGKELISMKDNGKGMNKNDAKLCIKRHATSKINKNEDLFAIRTLGFRGEALASICAVSKFTLITKQKQDLAGTEITAEKEKIKINDKGTEAGTLVKVEDLFYNVPARKKFLKNNEYELSSILDIIIRYSLAYPGISFKLANENKILISTTKTDDAINTIQAIYGNETAKNMIAVNYNDEAISIKGYIGKPNIARKDRQRQTIFINGRYVRSKEISDAVKQGFHSMLFLDREPVFMLEIKINEKKVDVNIHPRKEIVKIDNIDKIKEKVSIAVGNLLKQSNLILESELNESYSKPLQKYAFDKAKQTSLMFDSDDGDKIVETESAYKNMEKNYEMQSNLALKSNKIGEFKILGQINKAYIITENAEGLLIIDQHAAQERVNYEKLLRQMKSNAINKQALVKPIIMEMSAAESNIIKQYSEELKKTGYNIEEYGKNSIIIRTIPFIFERASKTLIEDMINELKEISSKKIQDEIEERIIRFSCRMSIKAGDEITFKEIETLLNELDKCEIPWTCPHGRPTIIKLRISEIEKKFKRK